MTTTRFGSHEPSSTLMAPPRARKRPPWRSTLAPDTGRYAAARSGSVTSVSTTTYADTAPMLCARPRRPTDRARNPYAFAGDDRDWPRERRHRTHALPRSRRTTAARLRTDARAGAHRVRALRHAVAIPGQRDPRVSCP